MKLANALCRYREMARSTEWPAVALTDQPAA
jgi:hypothetical protein